MSETKQCTRCQITKPISDFPWCKDYRLKAGGRVGSQCKACQNERAKKWQADNYERAFDTQKRWREQNREHYNTRMGLAAKRYLAARKNNTPAWADLKKIEEVYAAARALREAGHDVEVDHIVPLQGLAASGLHVHWNLQIIKRRQNRRKRSRTPENAAAIPHAWDHYCTIA